MHIEEGALVGAVIGSISITPNTTGGDVPFKGIVISIIDADDTPALTYQNYKFIQTEELTEAGIAVHPYGAIIFDTALSNEFPGNAQIVVEFNGKKYGANFGAIAQAYAGEEFAFELIENEGGGGGGGDQ